MSHICCACETKTKESRGASASQPEEMDIVNEHCSTVRQNARFEERQTTATNDHLPHGRGGSYARAPRAVQRTKEPAPGGVRASIGVPRKGTAGRVRRQL
jgi:hypothetical protein